MVNLVTIFRRETAAYFNSAIAYIFFIVFILLNGGLFMTQFFVLGRADMRPFFEPLPFFLAIFLPAVTMRLWAEEKKGNTFELLLTFPMSPHELVLGKFLASILFYLTALAGTLMIPVMLYVLGRADLGAIAGAYVGAVLIGAFFLAIGIFISGLVRDQIVAFILAMIICFGLHLIGTEFVAASIDGWVPGAGTLLGNFLGTGRHYDSFAKGVMDNRDALYFVLGILIFLVLNGFWIEGRMRPKAKMIFTTAAAIAIGIFFAANWLAAGLPLGRFDFTSGQIYTISPGTRNILKGLKAPVTAKLYISPVEKMPTGMKTLEQDILDKLDEFRIASGGKFQYKVFHMEAANVVEGGQSGESLEEQLSQKGIKPFQVQSIESDEVGVRLVYASIGLGYKEKAEQIIPHLVPDSVHELEYLLISKIYRMNLPSVPRVALVAPYEEREMDAQMKAILQQLGGGMAEGYREDEYELLPLALEYEGYQVSRIRLTEEEMVPEGVKTLAVVEPGQLNDRQRFELNRFLRGGGSLFLAVQNYQYQYGMSGRELKIEPVEKKPEINPLISEWGFTVDERILVDQQSDVVNVSGAAQIGPFEISVPVKVPIQILVTQGGMNPDVSITSRLATMFYLWGTALQTNEEKIRSQNLKVTPLLHSSRDAWTVPFSSATLTPESLKPYPGGDAGKAPFLLALMAEGQFADGFQGKPVPPWHKPDPAVQGAESTETDPPAEVTPAPGKLILIGAATPFQKNLIRGGGHLSFFLNSIDAITLGDELVHIRSKQAVDRSIGRVSTGTKIVWRFLVTLLVPILFASIGTLRMFLRRQSKQRYLKALALAPA